MQSGAICKDFHIKRKIQCKVQVYLYIDTCTLHQI